MSPSRVPLAMPGRLPAEVLSKANAAVAGVIARGWFLLGEETVRFEEEFARYCGVSYSVALANGTDALELALRACGVDVGSEVITVANAGGYTTTACLQIGAIPVYVDVSPASLTIDLDAAVAAVTPRTKAIVATHLYGWAVDVSNLRSRLLTEGFSGVRVVEDAAQAHGAIRRGVRTGAMGDAAAFSFYPTKNLGAFGDAGAVTTDDATIAAKVKQLRQYGWKSKYEPTIPGGRNSRMDEIQASVLRVLLPYLDTWNGVRREIVKRYVGVSTSESLRMIHAVDAEHYVGHLAVATSSDRGIAREILDLTEVSSSIHYPSLDTEHGRMVGVPMVSHDLTCSKSAVDQIITLPCFPTMTEDEIERVCHAIERIGSCNG